MRHKILMVLIVVALLTLFTGSLYAAPGDFIVNGNLGVGTTTPEGKAEINGNMKVNQNMTVQGNLVTNGSATVGGQLSVGAGGVKFADGTTQTTTKTLVWDQTVTGSPITYVTSPTLDGNTDGGYEIEFIIYNSSGGNVEFSMYYNNDQVASNYWTKFSDGGWQNNARLIGPLTNGQVCIWRGPVTRMLAGQISARLNIDIMYNSGLSIYLSHIKQYNLGDNLTRLSVIGSAPNGVGVGSRFRLWKRIQ